MVASAEQEQVAVLRVNRVRKTFGGTVALEDVSFDVHPGEIVALIGPNGSGKSTLFKVISGFAPPTRGEVYWLGKRIDTLGPERVAALGIATTFQEATTFANLTVAECFQVANRYRGDAAKSMSLVGMGEYASSLAGSLPYGLQRLLGVGLAAARGPQLLMLDEPGAGLTRVETDSLTKIVRDLCAGGRTTIVVDHNMGFVLPLCTRVVVLAAGRRIYDGSPANVILDENVRRTYLGEE